jgi:thiamine pyrophosphate-dependent acetolactate synthase large subunit-like protein
VTYYGTVHFWPMEAPGQFLYPLGYATLGYGLPAGIGAKLGNPERGVVVLVGDGAFMFTASELVTAAEQRLPIPVVVMNNHGFGEIADQMDGRGIARLAVDLTTPDFAALGRACGAHGERLSGLDGLGQAVQRALRADGPTVIDVDVSTRGA